MRLTRTGVGDAGRLRHHSADGDPPHGSLASAAAVEEPGRAGGPAAGGAGRSGPHTAARGPQDRGQRGCGRR